MPQVPASTIFVIISYTVTFINVKHLVSTVLIDVKFHVQWYGKNPCPFAGLMIFAIRILELRFQDDKLLLVFSKKQL